MQHEVAGEIIGGVGSRGAVNGGDHHEKRHHEGSFGGGGVDKGRKDQVDGEKSEKDGGSVASESENEPQSNAFDEVGFHHGTRHDEGGNIEPDDWVAQRGHGGFGFENAGKDEPADKQHRREVVGDGFADPQEKSCGKKAEHHLLSGVENGETEPVGRDKEDDGGNREPPGAEEPTNGRKRAFGQFVKRITVHVERIEIRTRSGSTNRGGSHRKTPYRNEIGW